MRAYEIFLPVVVLIGLMGTGSCCRKHFPPPDTSSSDSTKVEYRDSLVYRDSLISVPIPLESDQAIVKINDTSHRETSLAESDAWVGSDGFLHHNLRNKRGDIQFHIAIPERWIVDKAHTEKAATITRTVYVEKNLSWWQKFRLNCFWWLLAVAVGFAVWTFRKPLLSFIRKFI